MGSWLVDYLLFNRAHAHYSGDDLTRFLSGYTAVLNLADILFLALLAGPLMRRFGLRLGLVLNPAVVAALLAVMAVVVAGPGAAAYGLFVLAAVTRLADIVLTDGTTRTSVNASFQVVPIRDRLAVQAVVEGIGVPVAIGATGAVLLLMNLLGLGIGAVIVFGAVLSVIWTVSGAAMYRSYTRALADEMRRRSLVASAYDVAEDDAALQALLRSDDARDVRLGLDLLPGVASPASAGALRQASEHADPEVRMRALVQLAAGGDAQAAAEAAALATDLARSADPAERRAAASALGPRRIVDRRPEHARRASSTTRTRRSGRRRSTPWCPRTPESRKSSVGSLQRSRSPAPRAARPPRSGGSATRPSLSSQPRSPATERRGARLWCAQPPMRRRSTASPSSSPRSATATAWSCSRRSTRWMRPTAPASYRRTSSTRCSTTQPRTHARALAARVSLAASDGSLRRALEDESDLARRLVIAVLALRHGDRVRDAVRVVDRAEGQRRALGVEALDVLISREEAAIALPLVRRDLTPDEQAAALRHVEPPVRGPEDWIADMAEDPDGVWRSSWLALCARHASGR